MLLLQTESCFSVVFFFLLVLKHRIYWIIRVRREAAQVFLFWCKEQWLARSHCWSVSVILFCLPLGVTCSVAFGSRSRMALGKRLFLVSCCLLNIRRCRVAMWCGSVSVLHAIWVGAPELVQVLVKGICHSLVERMLSQKFAVASAPFGVTRMFEI